MSVTALKPYHFPAKDVRENFPAPLLYIGWEDHLLFCFPCREAKQHHRGKQQHPVFQVKRFQCVGHSGRVRSTKSNGRWGYSLIYVYVNVK